MNNMQGNVNNVDSMATYVVKKLWTIIAIALVLFALIMSLLRYSLPYLNNHKDYVQDYIANQYSIDIEFGELSASWQSHGPTIVLRDVSIKNGTQSPLSLIIGEVFFELEFWQSIAARKLQSNKVMLNQLDLAIDLTRIEGGDTNFPIVDALENVFFEQLSNFSVSNSRLTLISLENAKTIDIAKLSWLNRNKRHQGFGEFVLEDLSDNNVSFIIDLNGSVDNYSGTLFARAHELNLSSWINEFTGLDRQLASSKGNVEVWAQIENGDINRVDGKLLPSTFEWATEQTIINNTIDAQFAGIKRDQKWDIAISNLHIQTQDNSLTTNITGFIDTLNGAVVRIAEPLSIKPLLSLSALFSVDMADKLVMTSADAQLLELTALINENGLTLDAKFDGINWQEHNEITGIEDLQARLFWQGKRGKMLLSANDTQLYSSYYFDRELYIDEFNAPIIFDFTDTAKIIVDNAIGNVDGLNISIASEYAISNQFLSLAVNIDAFGISKVPTLLPNHLVDEGTNAFLKSAFTSKGKVKSANLILHGKPSEFPYAENTGVFQSKVKVEQAEFSFSEGWPALSNLDIEVLFENRGLSMTSASSSLDKVKLSNLQADIPNLDANALLTITADGEATSKEITNLMLQSSLADSLGRILDKDVIVDGQLATRLSLFIPITNGSQTRAEGEVYLNGNSLSIPAIDLEFTDTEGVVSFDNEKIEVRGLEASLLGQAVKVDLNTEQLDEAYNLFTSISGDWEAAKLAQFISDDLAALFVGSSNWKMDVNLDLMANDFKYSAELTTDLIGVNANLPYPLMKESQEKRSLSIKAEGDNLASSIDLNLKDIARFEGALAHKEKQFNRAHLALGPTELESRGLGFSISGNFDTLLVEQWIPFIKAITSDIDKSKPSLIGIPRRIFVDTEKLWFAGQSFNDVDLIVKRLDDQWIFEVDANEVRGNVTLFDEWFSKGIVIDAEYIRLAKADTEEQKAQRKLELAQMDYNPKDLPSINFTCKVCDIRGINLGRVELEAEPNSDGLKISQLLVNNESGNLNASGQWYKRNQDHYTFMAGDLNSNNFGEFISQLGFDSGIKDSSADMSFALTWQNSPMEIEFEHLDGEIFWELSDGYLTEVSDQGSRLFSLLSFNSLVRKLSLDFRDVFAKGFFYDNMNGSIQITQGKADTRDTNIDGAAGEIEIYGYTDLVDKSLNYNVSFAPNVTGNLPFLVYFFTVSPPSALAALAIDQVLTSTKVISNINYSVTGSIENPILIETGRESTEVDLPARRESLPTEDLPPFVPPTTDDLIEIEVKDGQSD